MKKPSKTIEPRVVYMVEYQQAIHRIEATTVKDLKAGLQALVPSLQSHSAQAAAHLAHLERAKVTGSDWSVRRAGVMAFQPDTDSMEKSPKASRRKAKPADGVDGSVVNPAEAAVVSHPLSSEDPDRLF